MTSGTGRAVSSQADVFAAPTQAWANPGTRPGVVFCHGALESALSIPNPNLAGQYPLLNALSSQFCVGIGDFSGNAWGNSTAQSNVSSMITWMQSMGAKTGKVALVGVSMGTTTALNYAKANPSKVACVVSILPAVNVNDFAANNRDGLASTVNAAYGGTYNDSTMGATYNPYVYASTFPSVPVALYYSTADSVALPTYVTSFLSACPTAIGKAVSTTLDHSEAAVAAAPIYGAGGIVPFIANYLT